MPRVHRVFPYRSDATDTEPGGPLFVPAVQGAGRLDNPEQYRVLYVAADPDGAVGEAFGDHRIWTTELLAGAPALPGSVMALGVYELRSALLDLDEPAALVARELRPSRVVSRDRTVTQRWALDIWRERRWAGVQWWSYWNPDWAVGGVWSPERLEVIAVTPLTADRAAVRGAAATLNRPWR